MNKIFSILLIRNEARLVAAPDWETAIRAASIVYLDADDLTDEKETPQ